MTREIDDAVSLVLAVTALLAFSILLWVRVKHETQINRFVLLDMLLVIAGVEFTVDAIKELISSTGVNFLGPEQAWLLAALVCRGALSAGGLALVLTVNHHRPH